MKGYFIFIVTLVLLLIFSVYYSENKEVSVITSKEASISSIFYDEFGDETDIILSAAKRNNCNTEQDLCILFAIRKAENGAKNKEFGVKHPKAWNTDLDTQAGWAAASIIKNRQRWSESRSQLPFIDFMASRYCPKKADYQGNINWVKNVNYWYNKLYKKY